MIFLDSNGDEIEINVGDTVYVDEGDGHLCREFRATVTGVGGNGQERVQTTAGSFYPSKVADIQILI